MWKLWSGNFQKEMDVVGIFSLQRLESWNSKMTQVEISRSYEALPSNDLIFSIWVTGNLLGTITDPIPMIFRISRLVGYVIVPHRVKHLVVFRGWCLVAKCQKTTWVGNREIFFTRNICLSPTTRVPKHPIQTNTVPKPSQTPKTLLVGKLATLLGWASFRVRICQFCSWLSVTTLRPWFFFGFFEISYPPSRMPTNTCRWSFGALAQKIHQIFRLVWEKLDSENRYFIGGSLLIVWWVYRVQPQNLHRYN